MAGELAPYKRLDLHFVWLSLPVAIVIGAGAWLGVPNVATPLVLLFFAWLISVAYVWVMVPARPGARAAIVLLTTFAFCAVGWTFWSLFKVDARIRMVNVMPDPRGGVDVELAVELTNRGKSTSLLHWREELVNPDGKVYVGSPMRLVGTFIDIYDGANQRHLHSLPDCDLTLETVRALQTGDSVFGIIAATFRDYPMPGNHQLDMNTRVELRASDMLGRTVSTGSNSIREVAGENLELFSCRVPEKP